jgi:hypothetical protein
MQEIRSNIDNFWKDGVKKEDILRSNSKVKPGISTYTQKKKFLEKKIEIKKPPQLFNSKYEKPGSHYEPKSSVYRYNS